MPVKEGDLPALWPFQARLGEKGVAATLEERHQLLEMMLDTVLAPIRRTTHVVDQPRPYADVPFEQLEAVVAKLDALDE